MPLKPIYFDTETTGVRFKEDRIIELAAFDPINNRTFNHLINPGIPIPKEATAIHNITDEMVENALSFKEVAERFTAFCDKDTVLIAHNGESFDKPFIETEFKRAGVEWPNYPIIDTLQWSRKYRPDLPKHSLQFLREVFKIEANNAHRALDDVIILHAVFSKMIDDLSYDDVFRLLKTKATLDRMPFGKHQGKALKEVPKSYLAWLKENGAFDKPENKALLEALVALELVTV